MATKRHKKARKRSKQLECMRFEFSCIFVFFVAIYHQLQIAILKEPE